MSQPEPVQELQTELQGLGERSASLSADIWRRLRRHKLAMLGLFFVIVLCLVAVFAPLVAPADPFDPELLDRLALPGRPSEITKTGTYILGSDQLWRDILSRVLYGARISLSVGIVSQLIVTILGVAAGALAGYYGGRVDSLVMRLADIMFAFPSLLFAIGVMVALGPSLYNIFIALAVTGWAGRARLIRGEVLRIKENEFVEAARAQGASDLLIILRHILPNSLGPLIVSITLGIPGAIMGEASLSFLGLGAQPPTASWGSMIYEARAFLRVDPLFSVWPGIAIMLTVFAFNLLGDGLRDALDPKSEM